MHSKKGGAVPVPAKAKSATIQRSPSGSYTTVGSPELFVSQSVPLPAADHRELNVKAASCTPSLFRKIPTDVLTAWTNSVGPTSPTGSGGWPAPQVAKSSPGMLLIGSGAGALGPGEATGSSAPGSVSLTPG